MVVDAMSKNPNSPPSNSKIVPPYIPPPPVDDPIVPPVEPNGLITVPFKDGSKMTISIAPDVVRLSFVCHKAGVEKALVLNRTGNAVKTIADLL